jgi:hypothetical protein
LKQLQSANAAQQQVVDTAVSERDALSAELKQGKTLLLKYDSIVSSNDVFSPVHFSRCRSCAAARGECKSHSGQLHRPCPFFKVYVGFYCMKGL